MLEGMKRRSTALSWLQQDCFRLASVAALLLSAMTITAFPCPVTRPAPASIEPSTSEQSKENTLNLVPGNPIRRELSPAKADFYQIALTTGQYLCIIIERGDLNLSATVSGPGKQKLFEIRNHQYGPIRLSLIAETSGVYQLEVRLLETGEGAAPCELRVEQLREAQAKDKACILAERDALQGEWLRDEWKKDSLREAIKKYEEAVAHWQAIGNQSEQASALRNAGDMHFVLTEYKETLDCYNHALALSRAAKDRRGEIESLNSIGYAYIYMGQMEKSLQYCAQALQFSQEINYRRGAAQAFNNIGEVHYFSSDMQKALSDFGQSLALWQAEADRRGQAQALNNMGYCYYDSRDIQKALDYYNRALPLWRAKNDARGQALSLTAIGATYSYLGEKQTALDFHKQAVELFRVMGDRSGEAATLNGIGYVYESLGEYQKALEIYSSALPLFRTAGNLEYEALTNLYLGRAYHWLANNQKAIESYERALLLTQTSKYRLIEAYALNYIGVAHTSLDNKETALYYYNKALPVYEFVKDQLGQAITLNNIGYIYDLSGDKKKALDYYNRALPLSRITKDHSAEISTLYNIAHAERDQGNLAEARSHMEASLKIIESLRTKVASQELRASYFASVYKHYGLCIDVLMQMRKQNSTEAIDAIALQVSERAHARSLLEMLAEDRTDAHREADPKLLEQATILRQQIDAKERARMQLLNGKHTMQQAALTEKELSDLMAEYHNVQAQIKAKSSRYAALTEPQPLTLKEIQQQVLDPNTLLLEYSLGDERSYLWAVTQTSFASFELPARKEIESQAKRVYELLTARQSSDTLSPAQHQARVASADADYWPQAARLSQMLLGSVASQLGTKRLLVIPEGALQYVPFSALPAPMDEAATSNDKKQRASLNAPASSLKLQPLVLDHEIISLPSASVLAILRREIAGRKPAPKAVAVIADPVFDQNDYRIKSSKKSSTPQAARPASSSELTRSLNDVGITQDGLNLPRLWSTQQEAREIMTVASAQGSFEALDFKANRAMAMSQDLAQYRIVHFATHGLLNNERPELSGIVLSLVDEQGNSQNGFLRLHDIYNLNLPAELVVLSACRTGLGKEIRGEGLVGLTRGFMYAGASRVMASLWNVNDLATANLMKRFYKAIMLDGLPPAAALRRAQVEMWKSGLWKAPYYWAAFVLQGEWK